jgi:hypothetical protein
MSHGPLAGHIGKDGEGVTDGGSSRPLIRNSSATDEVGLTSQLVPVRYVMCSKDYAPFDAIATDVTSRGG